VNQKPATEGITQLSCAHLTGCDESHLVEVADGYRLHQQVADAFTQLQRDAGKAGFELVISSGYRSFERQCAIWNGKAAGWRPVHDDDGRPVPMADLAPREQLHAILRFSALPGTSRHHWGTDLDVYDMAAVERDYAVQLTPGEVAAGGVFDPFHCWLDERMAAGKSRGFYRPYDRDNGGVALERWHLSFAPIAALCSGRVSAAALRACWDTCEGELLLRGEVEADWSEIMRRYLTVDKSWCPAHYYQ